MRCRVGIEHMQPAGFAHQHGITEHLKQQPVACVGLAPLPVVAPQFLLRIQEALLDGGHRAQIAAHRQHRAAFTELHGGIGHGDIGAAG